jgi:hypothetical protein
MRGYSLFSPAPVNARTISAFNQIRAEERADKAPDWLGTGLCYAALAGANLQAAQPAPNSAPHSAPHPAEDLENRKFLAAVPAQLEIPVHGGAIISFADDAAASHSMEWSMTFDGKGKLLRVTQVPVGLLTVSAVPSSVGELACTPLPPTSADLPGIPVP